jgi:hypothetical protein
MQNQNPSSANFFLIMRKTGCYVVDPELGPFHIDLENVIKNEVPRDRQLIWVLVVEYKHFQVMYCIGPVISIEYESNFRCTTQREISVQG